MIPSVVTAVPQAILTIALIPIVLKYIFGLEKKAHAAAKPTPLNPAQVPSQIVVKQAIAEAVSDKDSTKNSYSILNFKSASEPARKVFQNFMGDSK